MIGTRLETSGRITTGMWICLIALIASIAAALIHRYLIYAIWAVLPLIFIILRGRQKWRPFSAELTPDGIVAGERNDLIPYEAIENLTENGFPRQPESTARFSGPILVEHRSGSLIIPNHSMESPAGIYDFLHSMIQADPPLNSLPVELDERYREEITNFGEDRVHAFGVRRNIAIPHKGDGFRAFAISMILWGILALPLALAGIIEEPLAAAGGLMIGFGILFFFCGLLPLQYQRLSRKTAKRQAGLVVSPSGVAMIQGDVKGAMQWAELRNVSIQKPGSFRLSQGETMPGLGLKADGTTVVIADIYQRPLPAIHDLILRYWKG